MTDEPVAQGVTDDELVARIGAADAAALSELFRRRRADVYRVAMLMTGSPPAADDVTQDVFLAVMRDAARFESGRASVSAWLCGIARNHARRRLERDRGLLPLPEQPEPLPPNAVVHADPLNEMSSAQEIEMLRRAILTLPMHYREVVVLCDLQELSYADASVALECSIGTVRSRLHRGRALLGAKMQANGSAASTTAAKKISRCLA